MVKIFSHKTESDKIEHNVMIQKSIEEQSQETPYHSPNYGECNMETSQSDVSSAEKELEPWSGPARNYKPSFSSEHKIELRLRCAMVWYNRGQVFLKMGRHEEAISYFDRAIDLKQDYHEAWYGKGMAWELKGDLEESLYCYDRAIYLKKDFIGAWNSKTRVLNNLGRYKDASKCVEYISQIQRESAQDWYNKGLKYSKMSQFEEAIKCYDEVIKFYPSHSEAWLNKGLALYNLGRYREAREVLAYAAKLGNANTQQIIQILNKKGF